MNILWDFRLFSYGYGVRGVGVSTLRMAEAILAHGMDAQLFIWGQKDRIPLSFNNNRVVWIDYVPKTWKNDLVAIPLLLWRNRIDIVHYWIGLGPIPYMGMGLFHPCKSCITVHDMAVEYWNELEHCRAIRASMYWRIQKKLFLQAHAVVCISGATETDVRRCFRRLPKILQVLYAPMETIRRAKDDVIEKRFVTFGGAANKNLETVIKAFIEFRKTHPEFALSVVGQQDAGEDLARQTAGVVFDPIEAASDLLYRSTGLIVCSLHEGLGLPVLSAMAHQCPVIVSDIPVFHEVCGDGGRYVDQKDPLSIASGMEDVAGNRAQWVGRSKEAAGRYEILSAQTGGRWNEIYLQL